MVDLLDPLPFAARDIENLQRHRAPELPRGDAELVALDMMAGHLVPTDRLRSRTLVCKQTSSTMSVETEARFVIPADASTIVLLLGRPEDAIGRLPLTLAR